MFAFEIGVDVRAGTHEPRRDRHDLHVSSCQLRTQAFRERDCRKLRAAVWQQVRNTDLSPNRSNIHDARLSPTAHLWQSSKRCVYLTPKVVVHGLFEIGQTLVFNRPHGNHSGIVYEYVDCAEVILDLLHCGLDLLAIRDVTDKSHYCSARFLLNGSACAVQFLLVPRADCDLGAASSKFLRHSQAKTA